MMLLLFNLLFKLLKVGVAFPSAVTLVPIRMPKVKVLQQKQVTVLLSMALNVTSLTLSVTMMVDVFQP
ncbi:MAG: hypothetical protein CMJ52_06730 [Planctomycetaceae bacterium]|nr:hypothetical protein [Planctomycetaceae bacterium]